MLEIVLSHLQSLSIKSHDKKVSVHDGLKSLQDNLECLLQCITNLLSISAFTEAILHVLRGCDAKMKMRVGFVFVKRSLVFSCEIVQNIVFSDAVMYLLFPKCPWSSPGEQLYWLHQLLCSPILSQVA